MTTTSSTVHQKDTTYTKLFVGGLPYHTTDATLREYFRQFGDIDEAVVITDRQTGKSRGYGFVTMADRCAAERICKDPNPIIDGRKANVNLAFLGAKPRIHAADLLAALPFALKPVGSVTPAASGFTLPVGTQLTGLPQYIYHPATAAFFASTSPTAVPPPPGSPGTQFYQQQQHHHQGQFGPPPSTAAVVHPQYADYNMSSFAAAGYPPFYGCVPAAGQGCYVETTQPTGYPAAYGYLTMVATPGAFPFMQDVSGASSPPPPAASAAALSAGSCAFQTVQGRSAQYGTVIYQ
jgi:hypothetical protein